MKTLERYKEIKEMKFDDAVLLMNCLNWYKTFSEDAKIISDVLGITLKRENGVYFAEFPAEKLYDFLPRIVRAGHRVRIAE